MHKLETEVDVCREEQKRGVRKVTQIVLLERENLSGSSRMKSSTCSHVHVSEKASDGNAPERYMTSGGGRKGPEGSSSRDSDAGPLVCWRQGFTVPESLGLVLKIGWFLL